ncbi:MAG TPA: carbon-nitrogen hydrolase family protein [Planctomycetota bacterium]|nr:carbon-nitrogen hydrolase family protein [Planctomycetota bacterium]
MTPSLFDCWLRFSAIALLAVLLPAFGEEAPGLESAKKQGKLGRRLVGVSAICHPDGQSVAATEKLIDAAALDKPDIILLTEGCMQNTARKASSSEKNEKAELLSEPGAITQMLSRKAQQYRCYIMASYDRKSEKGPGRYNSAVLFDRDGKIAGCYDKTFPTIGEIEDGILPGKGPVAFDTDFGRIGAMICFDFNFEEILSQYKKQGVELICFLSNYRAGKLIPAAALRNNCFIASAVPGENGVIVDPLGRTQAESSAYGRIIFGRINLDSRIVHIDFNIDRVRKLKEKYGPQVKIETASPEAYYYLTSLHPEKSVNDMIEEFEIETLEAYMQRARAVREKHLPK